MRFLIDAQLPSGLCELFKESGHDAVHTSKFPEGNRTSDIEIIKVSTVEDRIVITKDNNFLNSHLLSSQPAKPLLVTTGNISNKMLLNIFRKNLQLIVEKFALTKMIEVTKSEIIEHT